VWSYNVLAAQTVHEHRQSLPVQGQPRHDCAELFGLEGDLKAPARVRSDIFFVESADCVIEVLTDALPQGACLLYAGLIEVHVGVIALDGCVFHGFRDFYDMAQR
jgi:hypothetical protein